MMGLTLKSRALGFTCATGAIAFSLVLLAGTIQCSLVGHLVVASAAAALSGWMCWAGARRVAATYAEAVNLATERLTQAASGDLDTPAPQRVAAMLPELALSLDGLLERVQANLHDANILAQFDAVTGLPNRGHFHQEAGRILAAEGSDARAMLLFIDLDKFKAVNDTFGHAKGDQLLVEVGDRLRATAESLAAGRHALIGRLAGDEFTVLMPSLESLEEAERIGDALLDALSEPYQLSGRSVDVGASIGIALKPDQGVFLDDLMRAADTAMYEAKAAGRGRCQSFTPGLAVRLADNKRLERELREAIDARQFVFVYQPQVRCGDGAAVAAEALLRWKHPKAGMLTPDAFIGHAEESGLIHALGAWSVEEIAATLQRWHKHGVTARLTVNISPRQIVRPDYFSEVQRAIRHHEAPPALLELEIGESVAMHCDEAARAGLTRLRELGSTITIDDFGTGFSNFSRLHELPIDRVKIDRSLIAGLVGSAHARTIVQSVVGLVHGLGMQAIAAGVETRAQRTILEVMGCDLIQGHAVARPMSEAELHRWLEARNGQKRRA